MANASQTVSCYDEQSKCSCVLSVRVNTNAVTVALTVHNCSSPLTDRSPNRRRPMKVTQDLCVWQIWPEIRDLTPRCQVHSYTWVDISTRSYLSFLSWTEGYKISAVPETARHWNQSVVTIHCACHAMTIHTATNLTECTSLKSICGDDTLRMWYGNNTHGSWSDRLHATEQPGACRARQAADQCLVKPNRCTNTWQLIENQQTRGSPLTAQPRPKSLVLWQWRLLTLLVTDLSHFIWGRKHTAITKRLLPPHGELTPRPLQTLTG
jgi:hypothetical protein